MSCKGGFLDIVKELAGKISDAWLEKFDKVYADLTKNTYDPTQWNQNLDETLTDLQKIFNRVDVLNLKEYELTDEDRALMDTVRDKLDFDETQFQNILKSLSTLQAVLGKIDGLKFEDLVNVPALVAGKIPKVKPDESGIFWVEPESAANTTWGGIQGDLKNQTDLLAFFPNIVPSVADLSQVTSAEKVIVYSYNGAKNPLLYKKKLGKHDGITFISNSKTYPTNVNEIEEWFTVDANDTEGWELVSYTLYDYMCGVSVEQTDFQIEWNTKALQALLNLSGQNKITRIKLVTSGDIVKKDTLIIKNNTDLEISEGTTLVNKIGINKPVLVSEYWYQTLNDPSDLSKKSDYLAIYGGGTIWYNKDGVAPGGHNRHAVCIAGVKKLKIGEGLNVGGAFKYSFMVANIDYLTANEINFNNESDGLHLQPPIYHAYIRNLRGHTGDDMFALTGGDYPDYDIGTRGDFTNIDVEGLYCDNSLCSVKIVGNTGVKFKNINIKGIYGVVQHAVVRVWAENYLTHTDAETINVENIGCTPGVGYPLCEVYDNSAGNVYINSLNIIGVSSNLTYTKVLDIRSGTDIKIYDAHVEVPRNAKFGVTIGDGAGNDKADIYSINISSKNTNLVDDDYSALLLLVRGVVRDATVSGRVFLKSKSNYIRQSGGTLLKATIKDTFYENGHVFRQFAKNVDNSTPYIFISNVKGKNSGKVALFHSGGKIFFSNTMLASTSGAVIETSNPGIVDIYGELGYGNSCIPATPISGHNYRSYSFGITADAANLQGTWKQLVSNPNSNFGAGEGFLAYVQGSGWKNIVTGSTA